MVGRTGCRKKVTAKDWRDVRLQAAAWYRLSVENLESGLTSTGVRTASRALHRTPVPTPEAPLQTKGAANGRRDCHKSGRMP